MSSFEVVVALVTSTQYFWSWIPAPGVLNVNHNYIRTSTKSIHSPYTMRILNWMPAKRLVASYVFDWIIIMYVRCLHQSVEECRVCTSNIPIQP